MPALEMYMPSVYHFFLFCFFAKRIHLYAIEAIRLDFAGKCVPVNGFGAPTGTKKFYLHNLLLIKTVFRSKDYFSWMLMNSDRQSSTKN
ncbi:hypothetical protein C4F49_16755 [Sphingobacterium sp. KB22]|uniref:Uncharacterized protein n=1 Tax=Sphingobacterium hungaricum TaxID=2082723 RepID=A0A928V1D7_9SPHI|nr:hypothetical protein [Sphingobacterium hungaricum]